MSITENLMNIVDKTINEYNMLHQGDTIVLGVSGGADSIVLLHVFTKLREKYSLNLRVAHVNHKIREGDAERDAYFVKEICSQWGIEYNLRESYIKTLSKEWGVGEEEAGRKVRYDFFNELAGKSGKIATAHNANDNVETVLMRIMRGTGINGLCGISFCRDNIIRPLLGVSRDMIEDYIDENNLIHITDSTNLVPIYTRNKIRLNLIPTMQQYNPQILRVMSDMIESINEDASYIDSQVDSVYKEISVENCRAVSYNYKYFKYESIKGIHSSILKRVFMRAAKDVMGQEYSLSQSDIDMCMNYKDYSVGSVIIMHDNFRLRVDYEGIWFEYIECYAEHQKKDEEYLVNLNIDENDVCISVGNLISLSKSYNEEIINNSTILHLPYYIYRGKTLVLRHRKDGDILRVNDKIHKKLNKFLVDKKISKFHRDNLWVLCDGNEVLWILGVFATRFEKRNGQFFNLMSVI